MGRDEVSSRNEAPLVSRSLGPAVSSQHLGTGRELVLVVLCLSVLVTNVDGTILNVALPSIVADLHATQSQLQWMVDAYMVVLAGLLLIAGWLGDQLGRKYVFLGGMAIFALGSGLSAFAASSGELITARAFMGVGAAAILPSTLSILTNVFVTPRDRARAIGLWSGMNGLGLAIGPLVGGWLLSRFWWGSVFLINVPVAMVTIAVGALVVPDSKNPSAKRPDVLGATASLVGVALLLWAIIEGPSRGWTSAPIVFGAFGAMAVLGVLVVIERRTSHPLVELSFFSSRRFSVAMLGLGLTVFALSGTMFLLTQYLQFVLGYSALATGLRITPIALVLVLVASLSMTLVRVVGTKVVVALGMGAIALGLGLLSATSADSTYLQDLPAFFLLGIGSGLSVAPCTDAVMGAVPRALAGVGSATNSTALQIGSALGVAVIGSLLSARYQTNMDQVLRHVSMPAAVETLAKGSLGGALALADRLGGTSGLQLATASRDSFISAMDFAVEVGALIVAGAIALVLVLLPSRESSRD